MSFIFNDTATTEIYTLSLHDALPILRKTKTGYSTDAKVLQQLAIEHPIADRIIAYRELAKLKGTYIDGLIGLIGEDGRSEEHTSELQSRQYLVCRLLLEKKNQLSTTHV